MRIRGFGFSGYRSFGGQVQLLHPMSKLNLVVGPNNAGKSNVLRFVERVLGSSERRPAGQMTFPRLDGYELPIGGDGNLTVLLAVHSDEALEMIVGTHSFDPKQRSDIGRVLATPAFRRTGDDLVWIEYSAEQQKGNQVLKFTGLQFVAAIEAVPGDVRSTITEASRVTQGTYGGKPEDDLARVISKQLDLLPLLPSVATIGAFRQVQAGPDDEAGYGGGGLIERLGRLQDPDATAQQDRVRFDLINTFVRDVLDDETAELRIPHHRETINVRLGRLLLPLDSLGTGIHEVVILAAAATILDEHLVCIEEPEIHLYPVLQRKLLGYLAEHTSNDYLIATHSGHILDSRIASIFRVSLGQEGSEIRFAAGPADLAEICAELGYRPSDLIQSNAVIWVEGPSDWLLLRHWLGLLDAELVEGVHYSVMFYGGRLLRHLTADDQDVDDFISLRRLNRNMAIVIDSDKTGAHARLNATKVRVRNELAAGTGLAWVTAGYTMENYVPVDLLRSALQRQRPGANLRWSGQRWINPFARGQITPAETVVDKVALARSITEGWHVGTPWPHDLRARIRALVAFIRTANGLTTS